MNGNHVNYGDAGRQSRPRTLAAIVLSRWHVYLVVVVVEVTPLLDSAVVGGGGGVVPGGGGTVVVTPGELDTVTPAGRVL